MRNDFEQLLWLHSIGIDDVATRQPINYFDVQIKMIINDSSQENLSSSKESEQIRVPKSKISFYETFKNEINKIENINLLEKYWNDTLKTKFNISKFWGLNNLNELKKSNILVIHEPPTRNDFAKYSVLQGKKRNLINNILFSILSAESEKEVQNIFVPILPIPSNNEIVFENLQAFQLMFLFRVKRIIEPSLVLLVGDRASTNILTKLKADNQLVQKEYDYFSIPELEYMMSVPEVKKTVWEEWKQKRKKIKNDLFL